MTASARHLGQRPGLTIVLQGALNPFSQVHLRLPVEHPARPRGVELRIAVEEVHPPPVNGRVQLERGTDIFDYSSQSQHRGQRQPNSVALASRGPNHFVQQLTESTRPGPGNDEALAQRLI